MCICEYSYILTLFLDNELTACKIFSTFMLFRCPPLFLFNENSDVPLNVSL